MRTAVVDYNTTRSLSKLTRAHNSQKATSSPTLKSATLRLAIRALASAGVTAVGKVDVTSTGVRKLLADATLAGVPSLDVHKEKSGFSEGTGTGTGGGPNMVGYQEKSAGLGRTSATATGVLGGLPAAAKLASVPGLDIPEEKTGFIEHWILAAFPRSRDGPNA